MLTLGYFGMFTVTDELMKRFENLLKRIRKNDSEWSLRNLTDELNFTRRPYEPSGDDDCLDFLGLLDAVHTFYIPFIILVGFVGNFLSCIVFLTTHLRMRSSSYYLAALSTADFGFLVSLLFVWINDSTGVQIFNKDGWCQALVYFSSVCSFLSVWLIVAFTVERFIAVQYPLHRPHMCTVKRAKIIIFVLVLTALVLHSYSFVTAGMIISEGEEICDLREEYAETMQTINIIDSLITLILPLILIVFMNSMITWNLVKFNATFKNCNSPTSSRGTELSLNRLTRSSSRQCRTQPSVASNSNDQAPRKRTPPPRAISVASYRNTISTRTQQNITKMLLLISTVFVLLNLPSYAIRLYVFIFYSLWRKSTPTHLWCLQQVFMLLYYTNFSINFLLYSMYGITFRRCLWNLLQNKFKFLSRFSCNSEQ